MDRIEAYNLSQTQIAGAEADIFFREYSGTKQRLIESIKPLENRIVFVPGGDYPLMNWRTPSEPAPLSETGEPLETIFLPSRARMHEVQKDQKLLDLSTQRV